MSTIILPLLTSNSTILRTLSARVLGAAVQNNGKVQVAAFKAGVIPILLRNIAVEKDFEVSYLKLILWNLFSMLDVTNYLFFRFDPALFTHCHV